MVVNAPTSNIVTAAELACGLLVATARNIPQANTALKNGEWKRSKYTGVELSEKVLGVVGLGRIGVLVAQRMSAFGMKIVAYDPYVQPRAAQMGVKLLSLDELLEVADFITVHLPKTPETLGLIGDEALHKVKPSVRIVNAARGGIVDEEALASALKEGRVASELDVYAKEPCTDSPAVPVRPGRLHPAPRRLHRRGAGEGGHRGRQVRPPRARPTSWSRTRSTSRAASSPRTYAPVSRSPRSSAGSSPRSRARSRPGSTSRCTARSPSTT